MFELTPKHFVDLVEKLYQDKKIPFGKGSLLSQNQLDEFYFHLTIFFVDDEPICEENVCKGLFKRDPLFSINVYYKYYVEAFGKEPFNLAQELHDAIELGVRYGEGEGSCFNVCTFKKVNGHKLTIKYLYCAMFADIPLFDKETTKTYNLSPKNKDLYEEAYSLGNLFEFPNKYSFKSIEKEVKKYAKQNRLALNKIKKILEEKNKNIL